MRAIVVEEIGGFQVWNIARPKPGVGEVLVEVAVAGLCRTDLKIIEVGHRDLVLPRVPGEEVVGTICEVGEEVPARHVGEAVYIYPGTSCGICKACAQDAENLCRDMRIMGFHRDGGFAQYVVAPLKSVIPVPEGLPFDLAVAAEPLSCCLNALELARLHPGESVGIWGGGPAGAYLSRAAAALGGEPTVVEPHEWRRHFHELAVASPGNQRFDVAVVAVGSPQGYAEALERLHPRGRLVVFSGLAKEAAMANVDFNDFHYGEKTIVGAYGCAYRHGVQALELIGSHQVEVADMITHRFDLGELATALDIVRSRTGMKILLYP